MRKKKRKLTLKSDFSELPKVEKLCAQITREMHFNEDQEANLGIALSEIVNNAIIHGNKLDPQKHVIVEVKYAAKEVEITVTDEGKGFNPEKLKDPREKDNLLRQNGRGIFMAEHLSKKVEIHPSPTGTKVTIVLEKNLKN